MIDIFRDGVDRAFRDRSFHFIPLERDFANRERILLRAYEDGAARLSSSAGTAHSPASPRTR